MSVSSPPRDPAVAASLGFLKGLLGDYRPRDFGIRLWDGTSWEPESGATRFILRFNHPGAVRAIFLRPSSLSIGEAFVGGAFDIDGDLEAACYLADYLFTRRLGFVGRLRYLMKVLALPRGRDNSGA